LKTADAMQAVLGWGPISKDLDINSVEYNKDTKANCHTFYGRANCTGSRWLIDNLGVSTFLQLSIYFIQKDVCITASKKSNFDES
jgi:hypothetical protein